MNWYLGVLKKYAVFSGRARRREYWMFALFNAIINAVLALLDNALGTTIATSPSTIGVLGLLYALAVLLPGLAVAARRLHDTDRSGWWLLLTFIPIIGWIVLLIFLILDSQPGENQYGPNPKGVLA